ncbi:NAD(P)/FAD-dependent oxidoreductase [Gramella lutea]|uniref:NAD(P)/FAD-dependent oxidoreductase n=1 Tax=Christiangramia lutea TaxID=1607951 RepID=A0A9X1V308_9FLAO|nr:NAD(P)/FAD-dependent oxidoreductase [Christiangramia lutea]
MRKAQVIIIGGGLAGLTAAIHLSQHNLEVILIEKESYPHHKVCGEYLSSEVFPYLNSLEINLATFRPPEINHLEFSSISGNSISCELEMGGIGISRYSMDNYLFEKTKALGCKFIQATVTSVKFKNDHFMVFTQDENYSSEFVLGAFGKRSNLDKSLKRDFVENRSGWLAVKAHYKTKSVDFPSNKVYLHNFKGGYCGLSKTELNTINVCYLATYSSFKEYRSTDDFREEVLMRNPHLREFFVTSEIAMARELSIGQVSFEKKSLIEDHILMLGDSAGLIHPLCGNGMAMAIHSAKIASEKILQFYSNEHFYRLDVEKSYKEEWRKEFAIRLRSGRILQRLLLNQTASEVSLKLINRIPGLLPQIIKRTHGKKVYA